VSVPRVLIVLSVIWAAAVPADASRGTFRIADTVKCGVSTNSLAEIQTVLDRASTGSTIIFPAAECSIDGTLRITKALVFQGQGIGASQIIQKSDTATTFLIATTGIVEMSGLFIGHSSPASAGACIDISPASGVNGGSRFVNIMLHQCFEGLRTTRAAHWILTRASISSPTSTGVWLQNNDNHDEGDGQISHSLFNLRPGTRGITWVSGGGLRVINNKFLGGSIPINVVPGPDVHTTGILLVTGNSLDWYESAGVQVYTAGISSFVMTNVTGNEFGGFVGGTAAVSISGSNGLNFGSTITGNSFNLTCLKKCDAKPQYGVTLSSGSQSIVTGNVFGGGSAAVAGIHVANTFNYATIGENSFSGAFDVVISNASTTTRLKTNTPLTWGAIQGLLGSPLAGSEVWCTDCRGAADSPYEAGSACQAPGGGAMARRVGSTWRCW
jgi:hypothetical protein